MAYIFTQNNEKKRVKKMHLDFGNVSLENIIMRRTYNKLNGVQKQKMKIINELKKSFKIPYGRIPAMKANSSRQSMNKREIKNLQMTILSDRQFIKSDYDNSPKRR